MTLNPQGTPASGSGSHSALVPVGTTSHAAGGRRAGEPASRGSLDLQGLLRALGRRWLLAVLLGLLLGGGAAAAVWVFLPSPAGTATALLHIDAVPGKIVFDQGERTAEFSIFQNTQVTLARSRIVLNAALRNSKVSALTWYHEQPDPLDWLEQNLKVSFAGSPEIMQFSLTHGKYNDDLTVMVDAVSEAYLALFVEKETKRRRERYDQLRDLAHGFETKIKDIRASLRKLQEQVGPGDKNILAIRQDTARVEYDQSKAELARLRGELRGLKLQVEAADKGFAPEAVMPLPPRAQAQFEKDTLLQQYEQRRRQIEEIIESVRSRAVQGDNEPIVIRYRAEVARLKEEVDKRRRQLAAEAEGQPQEDPAKDARSRQAVAKQRLEYLRELEKALATDAERLGKEAQVFVKTTLDLIEFQREVEEKEELVRAIQKQKAALEVELNAPARVKRIQEAVLRRPNEQARKLTASAGAGLALLALALLGVGFIEWRAHRLDSTTEVRQLGMKVIGTVPMYYAGRKADRGSAYWERRLVDSVDAARTLLLHIAGAGEVKVVMVVSAVSGEGKTSLSSQLAASLARGGRRTLLIDADLRKPAVHALFNLAESPGLSDVLRGEVPVAEAVQPTPVPNLFLLPAGSRDEQAAQALAHDGLAVVFATLRQAYDFVLVDSSPVLPVPDALMVVRHVDGVLFSIMQRVSRLPRVQAACERLAMVGARILGAVLSGSRDDDSYRYEYPAGPATGSDR
jgi:capsular exopolysaccharide synthesis family protein